MAFNRKLLYEIKCEESFATTWLANDRQQLKKFCEKHDINQINITDICNKIASKFNFTLQKNKSKRHQSMSLMKNSSYDDENEKMPFHIISKLYLGTVHIFQKQVDHLLELTTNLLEACKVKSFKVPTIPICISRKRKSTKEKRLHIVDKSENYIQTTNEYSLKLFLDNDYAAICYGEYDDILINIQKQDIQKTEVTVQEINEKITKVNYEANYYDINYIHENDDIDVDDDDVNDGFGNATEEELMQFFNFFQDQNESPSYMTTKFMRNTTKRKSNDHNVDICLPPKQIRINNKLSYKRGIDNDRSCLLNGIQHQGNGENKQQKLETSTILCKQNCMENLNCNVMIKNEIDVDDDGGQVLDIQNLSNDTSFNIGNDKQQQQQQQQQHQQRQGKGTKLIVDACTTIAKEVIDENIQRFKTNWALNTRRPLRIQFKKKLHQKKIASSVVKLLNKLNRPTIKMKLNFHKTYILNQQQFHDNFLMLIRGIFSIDHPEGYANIIYPNWLNNDSKQHRITEHTLWLSDQNHNLKNNNNNLNIDNTEETWNNHYTSGKYHYIEYRPYSIMKKLLQIWQQTEFNAIDAKQFCNAAPTNVERALTFASILVLITMNLIVVTQMDNTINIDKIILSNETKKLICDYIRNSNT